MTDTNFALAALPPELQGQALDLQRRQALTDALLAHSLQGSPQPTNPGRLASRMNPLQPLAQVFGAGMAGKASRDLSGQEVALGQRANQYMIDILTKSQALRNGTPGTAGTPESAEDGLPPTSGTPAMAGNDVANALLMQHPATRGLGLEMMKRNMEMQAFKRAAGTSGSGGTGGGTGPDGLPGFGSPAGGQPMEFWLQADPTGKAYLEQRAKDYTKSNDPVVNRGYGIGRMVNGKYVADPASLEQATGMEQTKADIAAKYDQPITLKMSGGQDIQLSRPEYREWQQTGKLPPRYSPDGGAASGGKEPIGQFSGDLSQIQGEISRIADPTERAAAQRALENQIGMTSKAPPVAPVAPAAPPLGIPGSAQSQEDIIKQKGQTAAAEQIGQGLGKEAVATFSDGAQAVQANRQLDNMSQLATGFTPNRFQALKSTFAAYLNGIGMPESTVNSMLGTNVGDIRALTSQAVQLAGKLTRQSDSQPSQIQFLKNLQSMPNADMTAEGFQKVVGYMKDLNNYRIEKMIAQQQWLSSHSAGDVTGFEADWATKAKSLPFVWNQPQAKMPAPSRPINEKPQVKAMPDAVPGAVQPSVGAKHVPYKEPVPQGDAPDGVDPDLWHNYMTPKEKALWHK